MAVGALFEVEGFTQEHYDEILRRLGEEPPEGALVHIAGPTATGWRVIEVWESEDAQRRFQGSRLDPAFDQAGMERVSPTFFPVHMTLPPPEALSGLTAAPG